MRTVELRLTMSHVDAEQSVALSDWLFCHKLSSKHSYFLLIFSVFFSKWRKVLFFSPQTVWCNFRLFCPKQLHPCFCFIFLSPTVVDKAANTSRISSIFKQVHLTVQENAKLAKKKASVGGNGNKKKIAADRSTQTLFKAVEQKKNENWK